MSNQDLSIVDKAVKNNIKQSLLKNYSNNGLLRGLIQIFPFGGLFDTVMTTSYNNILIDRSKTFFNELGKGEIMLTQEIIESEDFIHAYFSTFKAAVFTRQRKKIRFFARLLKNGVTGNQINSPDDYEEILNILDELTLKEILVLNLLDKHENELYVENPEDKTEDPTYKKASTIWKNFIEEGCSTTLQTKEEFEAFLSRLIRTGCFAQTTYTPFSFGHYGGFGYLTKKYYKLKDLIELEGRDLVYYNKFKS